MGKGNDYLFMKLDSFKKVSRRSGPKARTMSPGSKFRIIYRFRRIRWGIYISLLLGFYLFKGIHISPDPDIVIIGYGFYGILGIIAILLFLSGGKRLMNMIWIIEYGTAAPATVTGISEWLVRISSSWKNFGRVDRYKKGKIGCSFTDSSGKPHRFTVNSYRDHSYKKGDTLSIIYDPGMPGNVIVMKALPGFVKTDPAL